MKKRVTIDVEKLEKLLPEMLIHNQDNLNEMHRRLFKLWEKAGSLAIPEDFRQEIFNAKEWCLENIVHHPHI